MDTNKNLRNRSKVWIIRDIPTKQQSYVPVLFIDQNCL